MEKIKFRALTFDDVFLLPRYTDFMPSEAELDTRVSKNISDIFVQQECFQSTKIQKNQDL